jgi:MFS superfamily sulfate permease-like transporter
MPVSQDCLVRLVGYAFFGSSRQLAIGPTLSHLTHDRRNSGGMAGGDGQRYAEIESLAGFTVAAFCVIVWILQLSVLVKLIRDRILIGFKAGAGLTIAAGFTDRQCTQQAAGKPAEHWKHVNPSFASVHKVHRGSAAAISQIWRHDLCGSYEVQLRDLDPNVSARG